MHLLLLLLIPLEVFKDHAAQIALEMAHASAATTASLQFDMDANESASLTYFDIRGNLFTFN